MRKSLFCLCTILCVILIFVGCDTSKNNISIKQLPKPTLTKDMSVGIGILSDYESDEKIIFHGYFGVFIYDIKAQDIIVAIDLEKTLGTNQIQGIPYVNVVANQDGSEIMLHLEGSSEESEKMAYYINTSDGSYTYKEYKPFDKNAKIDDSQKYSGDTLENLIYTDDNKIYKVFENWKF